MAAIEAFFLGNAFGAAVPEPPETRYYGSKPIPWATWARERKRKRINDELLLLLLEGV